MKNQRFTAPLSIVAFFAVFGFLSGVALGAGPRVTPEIVRMGTLYGGALLRVEGVKAPEAEIIVTVRGGTVKETFNKLGRVGPIWGITGKVTITNTPSLLLVFSSVPVSACLPREVIDQYGLDRIAVTKQMHIASDTADYDRIAEDYWRYKIRQGNYRLVNGTIETRPAGEDGIPYSLEFTLPKTAAAGKYAIGVLECQGGEIVRATELPLQVVEVGFPALVTFLATQHAAAYGAIAVVVAMLAGFGIDLIAARILKKRIVGDYRELQD